MGQGDTRKLTCILYLNPDWHLELGGEFRLWTAKDEVIDIMPKGDRLVVFESDKLVHSVLPSIAPKPEDHRYALTVWMPTLDPKEISFDPVHEEKHFGDDKVSA